MEMQPDKANNSGDLSGGLNVIKSDRDKYELLQYYVSKLETRTDKTGIFKFLLEFMNSIAAGHLEIAPACIFLVNSETLEFDLVVYEPEGINTDVFKKEIEWQINNGIVAWCISNRRATFTPSVDSTAVLNCLLIPISTIERTLGIALIYVNIKEKDFCRESLHIITLASMQTALYADNLTIMKELRNAQSRIVHTEKLSAIGQLAAGIAHEINNPASFVLGNCDVLTGYIEAFKKMIKIYEEKCQDVELLNKSKELDIDYIIQDIDSLINANMDGLRRIIEIVANLKDFAHIDRKEIFKEADLEESFMKTLQIANNEIKYCAEVHIDFKKVSPVMCNSGEINQVFLNILINAAQAIKSQKLNKRGNISISSFDDISSVYFEIKDDGPGIPDENLTKIFDPFFTTKEVGQGTGLGLNIAYDIIVNKHGGEISVKSEIGKGTCFKIRIPRKN